MRPWASTRAGTRPPTSWSSWHGRSRRRTQGGTDMEPIVYLHFNGDCYQAMTHYAEVLGGTVAGVFRNADAPDAESRMPGGDHLVLNMAIRLGETMMMASDCPEEGCAEAMYRVPTGFAVSIDPGSNAEFDRVYAALADGARQVQMAPAETFWADRFAMFTDRFGTPWMLNHSGSKMADCSLPAA